MSDDSSTVERPFAMREAGGSNPLHRKLYLQQFEVTPEGRFICARCGANKASIYTADDHMMAGCNDTRNNKDLSTLQKQTMGQ